MTVNEIEEYLSQKNTQLDDCVGEEIDNFRLKAIEIQDESNANYFWCLSQIFRIQKMFLSAVSFLKNQHFENAWNSLEQIDIKIGYLENNFDITRDNDRYHIAFIGKIVLEYQKLFPYEYFFSRESIIKSEICSICGEPISLRHPCCHKVGKLYMGELCLRKITDIEFKAISIVSDSFDKYAFVKLPDQEYNYGMLRMLMAEIRSPYDDFYVETVKVRKPNYQRIGRNDRCPCGSGKKYKKCHEGTKDELMDHYIVHMKNHLRKGTGLAGIFNTWK